MGARKEHAHLKGQELRRVFLPHCEFRSPAELMHLQLLLTNSQINQALEVQPASFRCTNESFQAASTVCCTVACLLAHRCGLPHIDALS